MLVKSIPTTADCEDSSSTQVLRRLQFNCCRMSFSLLFETVASVKDVIIWSGPDGFSLLGERLTRGDV